MQFLTDMDQIVVMENVNIKILTIIITRLISRVTFILGKNIIKGYI